MKKTNLLGLSIMLVSGIIGAQSIWTGSAATGSSTDFPGTSSIFRAKSNTFPPGTILRVTNPRGGNSVDVEVISRLDTPGLLILLEQAASDIIDIPEDYVLPVQISPVSKLRLDNAVADTPYKNIYNADPDYNPVVVLDDRQTLQPYQTTVPYEASETSVNTVPLQEQIPEEPEEHQITYTVIPRDIAEEEAEEPVPVELPESAYKKLASATLQETPASEEPAPPLIQEDKPQSIADRFNAGELAETSIEYYTKEKSGEWEEFTEKEPVATSVSADTFPLYKDPGQANNFHPVYDLTETSTVMIPEKKSDTPPFTEDKVAVESLRYTEDIPTAVIPEKKSDTPPFTEDKVGIGKPHITEEDPAAGKSVNEFPYIDDSALYTDRSPHVPPETIPDKASPGYRDDIPPFTTDLSPYDDKSPESTPGEYPDESSLYTEAPLLVDDKMLTDEDINPYTDETPSRAVDKPLLDKRSYTLADETEKTGEEGIYFLKPDELIPPKPEEWNTLSGNDILVAESTSPDKSSGEKLPAGDSKNDTTDSGTWIQKYALTSVQPGTGEQYVQIGAYSNIEVMKETISKLKVSSPNYPLSYELNADSAVYRLLVGPLKPAERAVVLRTMRSSLSPDAFHYSP